MLSKKIDHEEIDDELLNLDVTNRDFIESVPKYEMRKDSMPAQVAFDLIHDELNLDGNPALNLASFVTTFMEKEADKLILENVNKNYVDQDEYPQTIEIQNRCVNMLANLFHAPKENVFTGTATVGSSEAIHLAGIALKWKWKQRRQQKGLPCDKPNIVMGQNVQICWEKFARYFEVEPRYVFLTEDRFVIDVQKALALVDENTIAVVGILGSTLSGEFEPIEELNKAIDELNKKTGWEVPIHVDAASGGFVAPFVYPDLLWDFRLRWVKSINVSGHKYGLVYPGIGWIIWRDKEELSKELIFHVNYLGNDEPTFNLNFSKPASQVIAQYYNFLRLGKDGYMRIMKKLLTISKYIAKSIEDLECFEMLSKNNALPVICCKLKDDSLFDVFDLSRKLRQRGWIVPAYTMAPNAENIAVLRIVIREGFNRDLADILLLDIKQALKFFTKTPVKKTTKKKRKFMAKVC